MKNDAHYLGTFNTISEAWKLYPNGGGFGDYIIVEGEVIKWNEYSKSWGEQTEDAGTQRPAETIPHGMDVEGSVKIRDDLNIGEYVPKSVGAGIDKHGNADVRTMTTDKLWVKYDGEHITLAEYIKLFKTELPPDWEEYTKAPLFDEIRILVFDPNTNEKFYTTIGALKKLIRDSIAAGGIGTGTFDIEILRTDEPYAIPTDNNVMSSLRTLMAIQAAIAPLAGEYLSRINDDTAQGLITFLKGIIASDLSTFTDLIASGKIIAENIDVKNHLLTNTLKVILQADLQTILLRGQMNSETFASGFLGHGMRLRKDGEDWELELDKLTVRKAMTVYELIVQEIRYQGGQHIYGPAGAKLTNVEDKGSYWRCEHDGTSDFITGSQVLSQRFDVGSRAQNPDGLKSFDGARIKRYWRLVTGYGSGWFNLSKTDCEKGSDYPEVGDHVAVLGHRTNTDWQNAIMLTSTGTDTPYTAYYARINSYSTKGKEVIREGNLNGIVDAQFGQLRGHGLYAENVYLKGQFRLNNNKLIEDAINEANKQEYIGALNLLREYDGRFDFKYWGEDGEKVEVDFNEINPHTVMILCDRDYIIVTEDNLAIKIIL